MGFPFGGNGAPLKFSDLRGEFGGADPVSFSEYYRDAGLVTDNNTGVPTSGTVKLSDFYGASKKFVLTLSSTTTNFDAVTALTAAGWGGSSYFEIVVNSAVWVYSTNTANAALTVSGSFPYGFAVKNSGNIAGKGGRGGYYNSASDKSLNGLPGGPALVVNNSYLTAPMSILNNSGAYIAGGGGGGGGMNNGEVVGGGGGGAGGGDGGQAYQTRGGFTLGSPGGGGGAGSAGTDGTGQGNGTVQSGGGGAGGGGGGYNLDGISSTRDGGGSGAGGGRILPGTGGVGNDTGRDGGAGGSASSVGSDASFNPDSLRGGAGGGGGWGATGGGGKGDLGNTTGGAGGKSIVYNGATVTLTNNGTIYGETAA